jgi:tetratricopeptide (TPR) repeat protein
VDLDPLSQFILANAALCAHRGRDYDRALAFWERMITLDPNQHMGHLLGSLTLAAVGRVDEALAAARQVRGMVGALADPGLADVCAAAGRGDEARDILARCEARRGSQHGWPFALAMAYTRLGEINTAFARLEEAYEERDFWMVWLGVQPELDPLRVDPRYHALLRRVNLAGGPP